MTTATDTITALDVLRKLPQWVGGDDNKAPRDPHTGGMAKSNDPATWGTYGEAAAGQRRYQWPYIGFCLDYEALPIVFIDLDHCIDANGNMARWARDIIEDIDSYTEISPSGTGVHILAAANIPRNVGDSKKRDDIPEMYKERRWLTVTGDHIEGTPWIIQPRFDEVAALYEHTRALLNTNYNAATVTRAQHVHSDNDGDHVQAMLEMLAPWRADGYQDWLNTGFALCELGERGLSMWKQWSTQSDKYRPGDCERRWHGMTPGGGISVRSLWAWAEQDNAAAYRQYWDAQRARNTSTATTTATAGDPTAVKFAGDVTVSLQSRPKMLTDLGNADRFAEQHMGRVKHVAAWGWMVWDGRRWQRDDTGMVMELAKETALAIFQEARAYADDVTRAVDDLAKLTATGGNDAQRAAIEARQRDAESRRKKATAWAMKSQDRSRLAAMLALAESVPGIAGRPDAFDPDPWLFNCSNGVIDLRSGELLEHDPAFMMTKFSPVVYDPHAICHLWQTFLDRVLPGDLGEFVQRAAGYALTGNTREQCLFFAHGTGANGKSTLLNTLLTILGDYGQKMPMSGLLAKSYEGGPTPEIARLHGARLVIASEIEQGRRLNESLVKDLTGGDRLTARFMRQDYFEFDPLFKLWIYGNHKPTIRGTDEGIWRRLRMIPFDVVIPEKERDSDLIEKLKPEYPGILTWLVRGCMAWQNSGLDEPAAVTVATAGYRGEMDVIGQFLNECATAGAAYWVTFAELRHAYESWCNANGETPIGGRRFGNELTRRGFVADRGAGNAAVRRGLGLLTIIETH